MIKRTRSYAVVHGMKVDDNGNVEQCDVTVDSRCKKDDVIKRRAQRENSAFLPVSVTYREQVCTMDDDTFYANCQYGEDIEVVPGTEETPAEEQENNN